MNCDDIRNELVAHIHGELSDADRDRVGRHLVECESCARTVRSLRATLGLVARVAAPLEPSADFRARLAARIASGSRSSTSSRRLLTLPRGRARLSWTQSIRQRLRQSPYLAASVALHAAVIALLITGSLLWGWGRAERVDKPQIMLNPAQELLSARLHAPRIERARIGDRLQVGDIIPTAVAVYLAEGADGCLLVYPVGGRYQSEKAFLQRIDSADRGSLARVELLDGAVTLPVAFQASCPEGQELTLINLLAVRGQERLEIWPSDAWKAYQDNQDLT